MGIVFPYLVGILLCLAQFAAALPWLAVLDWPTFRASARRPSTWLGAIVGVALGGIVLGVLLAIVQDEKTLLLWGRLYGAVFHVQLAVDLFVFVHLLLLTVWPKGAAVCLAAFREALRQPMFWVLVLAGIFIMLFSLIIPYFTFGEDAKMVKEIGYDLIMLLGVVFAILTASMSISDEIEGRTAITLMSKPVSRRQFLVGKFLGILLSAGVMTCLLGWIFAWTIWLKPIWDPQSVGGDPPGPPAWLEAWRQSLSWSGPGALPAVNFALGAAVWLVEASDIMPGLLLGFCQVSVLLALAVALATRMPMEVNLVTCAVVFVLGHLSHVLVLVSGDNQFVKVVANIFDTLLPGLERFNVVPLIARDIPPPPGDFFWYVLSVTAYAAMYTVIGLLLGLILFEDRDLA
jgi:hypothetical protein